MFNNNIKKTYLTKEPLAFIVTLIKESISTLYKSVGGSLKKSQVDLASNKLLYNCYNCYKLNILYRQTSSQKSHM